MQRIHRKERENRKRKQKSKQKKRKTHLTHTGLLMEGLESALLLLGAYPLFQEHLHSFADFLSDR
jgi:hypothetical protein